MIDGQFCFSLKKHPFQYMNNISWDPEHLLARQLASFTFSLKMIASYSISVQNTNTITNKNTVGNFDVAWLNLAPNINNQKCC